MHIIHILKDPKMSTMRATGRLYLRHSFWFVASSTFHAGDAAKAVCVWSGRRMMVAVCLVLAFFLANYIAWPDIFFPPSLSHPVSCSVICFCVLTRISAIISQ